MVQKMQDVAKRMVCGSPVCISIHSFIKHMSFPKVHP